MSLANKLTIFRIVLIPPVLVFVSLDGALMAWLAAALFTLAAVTDILDGMVARKQNTISTFGKVMDPIADKLLVVSALIPLVAQGALPAWMVVVVIGREFILNGLRILSTASRGEVIAASWWGKTKTVLQDVMIVVLMLRHQITGFWGGQVFIQILVWAALVLTVLSTTDYLWKNRRVWLSMELHGGKG